MLQQVSRGHLRRVRPPVALPRLQRQRPRGSSSSAASATEPAGRSQARELEVEIPAGIHDGQRIRVTGEGHAGALGGRPGDAYVRVRVRADERFVREGNDIFSQVDLTVVAGRARREGLGRDARRAPRSSTSPPGRSPARCGCFAGKGMPVLQGFGRGDHRVLVNVTVPRRLTDEQRRLLDGVRGAER